jgi:hypothetical protein
MTHNPTPKSLLSKGDGLVETDSTASQLFEWIDFHDPALEPLAWTQTAWWHPDYSDHYVNYRSPSLS